MSSPMSSLSLLVTGFGAFPGAPSNPSEKIVRALGGAFARRMERLGVRLERRIIPVVWDKTPAALRALEAELAPDAVLHLGLAGKRSRVTVELRAHNRNRPLSVDADARRAPLRWIERGQPFTLPSRVSAPRLVTALDRQTPSALSNDAGAYLCNLSLWTSLRQGSPGRPVVFVHIPRAQNPRAKKGRANRPTLAAMTAMAQAACLELARQARFNSRQ